MQLRWIRPVAIIVKAQDTTGYDHTGLRIHGNVPEGFDGFGGGLAAVCAPRVTRNQIGRVTRSL